MEYELLGVSVLNSENYTTIPTDDLPIAEFYNVKWNLPELKQHDGRDVTITSNGDVTICSDGYIWANFNLAEVPSYVHQLTSHIFAKASLAFDN